MSLNPKHIIISPGPGRPENAGISVDVINNLKDKIPILGVCLGHQAIGMAYGGLICRAKTPMHGKTSTIVHDGKGIFKGLQDPFEAGRYHSLVLSPDEVPSSPDTLTEALSLACGLHATMSGWSATTSWSCE